MMKLNFTTERLVWWPVHVREPRDGGRVAQHKFEAQFLLLDQDKQTEAVAGDDGDRELLRRTVKNWREVKTEAGEDVPYSAESMEQMIAFAFVRQGFVQAYLQAAAGAKAKN